jgi:hypothetical protein
MEKAKILTALLLCCAINAFSQNISRPPFVKKGLMNVSLGLSGGVMAFEPVQNIYFKGDFAYCMEDQIAIRADFFVFVPDAGFKGQLDQNSSFLLGAEYHFPFSRFDVSMIFQPGISLVYYEEGVSEKKTQAEPVLSLGLVTSYYILSNFHIFFSTQYVHGSYFMEEPKPYRLDEVRFSGGIGINVFVNHTPVFQRKRPRF